MGSRSFGSRQPAKAHLLRNRGLGGEVQDLRNDVEAAFTHLESEVDGINTDIDANAAADVAGPASSTANAVARYSGTTGKIVKDSAVTIDDLGTIIGAVTSSGTPSGTGNKLVDSADPRLASAGFMARAKTFADSPYTILSTDEVLLVDASGGNVQLNLPANPTTSKYLQIWKVDTSTNKIVLHPGASQTINGASAGSNLDPMPDSDVGGTVMMWSVLYPAVVANQWLVG